MSTKNLALSQRVSQRRVQQLIKLYKDNGQIILKKRGRPRKHIPFDHIKLVLKEHPNNSGACVLEKKLLQSIKSTFLIIPYI